MAHYLKKKHIWWFLPVIILLIYHYADSPLREELASGFLPRSKYEDPACIKNPTPLCLKAMIENYRKNTPIASGFKPRIPIEEQLQNINKSTEDPPKKCSRYALLAYRMIYNGGSDGGNDTFAKFSRNRIPKQFKPDASWQNLINDWSSLTKTLPEPDKSDNFIYIGEKLLSIGQIQEAKDYLSKVVSPSERSMWRLMKAQNEFGIKNIPAHINYKFLNTPTKAEDLINRGNSSEAIPLLVQDSDATITKKTPFNAKEIVSRLRRNSKLLYRAGEKEKALEFADKARNIEASDSILSPFRQYDSISKSYREIGQIERAKEVMLPFIKKIRNSCTLFGDSYNTAYAEEFVFLGMPSVAKSKASDTCSGNKSAAWKNVYMASHETGQKAPDIEEIVRNVGSDNEMGLYIDLAAFHFSRDEENEGNRLLEKAVSSISTQTKHLNTCSISYIAYFSNRLDLLDIILTKTVRGIDRYIHDPIVKMELFSSLEKCNVQIRE